MRVYLAGPMRGIPDWNFPTFDEAKKRWEARGHEVFSPASIARAMGYALKPGEDQATSRAQPNNDVGRSHLEHVMLSDILCISKSDALALLPGWENSTGTTVELAYAQFLGLDVYCAVRMVQLAVVSKPWNIAYGRFGPEVLTEDFVSY